MKSNLCSLQGPAGSDHSKQHTNISRYCYLKIHMSLFLCCSVASSPDFGYTRLVFRDWLVDETSMVGDQWEDLSTKCAHPSRV